MDTEKDFKRSFYDKVLDYREAASWEVPNIKLLKVFWTNFY